MKVQRRAQLSIYLEARVAALQSLDVRSAGQCQRDAGDNLTVRRLGPLHSV